MLLTFATEGDVLADYSSVLALGLFVVVGTIIILGMANKGTPSEVPIPTAIRIGAFAYLLLVVVSYRQTYGSFIAADISAQEARLSFAGSLYHSTILKREQIQDVLFGYPGKGEPQSCYIKFITTSGDSYRSSTRAGKVCKDYRWQILALMKG